MENKSNEALNLKDIKMSQIMELSPIEVAAKLDGLVRSIELTSDYLELESGETIRAIYLGQTTFKSTDNKGRSVEVPAVRIYTPGGNKITAGIVIVNSLSNVPEFSPIEIVSKGEVDLGAGKKYNDYAVILLSEKE